jgi:hypothetical protein
MTREARMKELQLLDAARRKFMTFTQQQKETELARLDDEIRRKVRQQMFDSMFHRVRVCVGNSCRTIALRIVHFFFFFFLFANLPCYKTVLCHLLVTLLMAHN